MHITEIMSEGRLRDAVEDGFVKVQHHPTLPLRILNYTDKAVYARVWSDEVRRSRGLIIDGNNEVVATGPQKFFNVGEPSAKEYPMNTLVVPHRKEDGSLGIVWYYAGTYGVATRGSFMSDQAVHATKLLHTPEYGWLRETVRRDAYHTPVVEIVYPENRIVLDYSGLDALIPLGRVENRKGLITDRFKNNPNVAYRVYTLAEVLAMKVPDDEEGYVIDVKDGYSGVTIDHLKLKGERYKDLHAAIYGLTEKRIWEQMAKGTTVDYIAQLPDEVQPWADEVYDRLSKAVDFLTYNIEMDYLGIEYLKDDRGDFARTAKVFPHPSALFALLDGNHDRVRDYILEQVKPGHVPFASAPSSDNN